VTDLYRKIIADRSGLEKIVARIPGFRGYKEMSARREADRMIREHVVQALKEQMQRLVAIEKKAMSGGNLSFVGKSKSAKTNYQTFIDRVQTAAPGYSGFYSANKVGSEELERVYAFDAALIKYADEMRGILDALDHALTQKEKVDETLTALESLVIDANAAFGMRDNVVTEIV
jgi:hypothetical protein